MLRNRYNQIPHQTNIEIKVGIIYKIAQIKDCIIYKTAQRESQKNNFCTVDCHQTILNKANKIWRQTESWWTMTIRKKQTNTKQKPCLGTISNKSMGWAELKQVSLVRKCKSDLFTSNVLTW